MISTILIINLIIFYFLIKDYLIDRLSKSSVLLYNTKQLYYSYVVLALFLIFFIIGLRFLNLFLNRRKLIDFKLEFFHFKFFLNEYFFNNIGLIILFILLIFFLRSILFIEVRKSYLRLHYYVFLAFEPYFLFCKSLKLRFFFFIKKSKVIYVVSAFIFKALFFDNYVMYVGFLPYYVLYHFFFSCFQYLDFFEFSFDRGIVKNYFPDFFLHHRCRL